MTVAAREPGQDRGPRSSRAGLAGHLDRLVGSLRDPGWPWSLTWLRALFGWALLRAWVILGLWTVLWAAYSMRTGMMGSWGIFPNAARIMLKGGESGGFHLYFLRPDYQFGPISTLAAAPLAYVPLVTSKWVAGILMTACGLWLVAVIGGFGPRGMSLPTPGPVGLGGLLVMPVWTALTLTAGHLDDVLALGFGLFGVLQVRRGSPISAAILLALAVDSKPWAVAFGVALLALPRTQWFRSVCVWAGVIMVAWLPFFVVDPGTINAMKYQLLMSPDSVLSLLDLSGVLPPWYRPAQLILAVTVGIVLARAGAPHAVLLSTVASRLLFDPEVAGYYTAGAVLVAYLVDRSCSRGIPWFTLAALGLLWLPQMLEQPPDWNPVAPWLRLIWGVGTLVALIVVFGWRDRSGGREPTLTTPASSGAALAG